MESKTERKHALMSATEFASMDPDVELKRRLISSTTFRGLAGRRISAGTRIDPVGVRTWNGKHSGSRCVDLSVSAQCDGRFVDKDHSPVCSLCLQNPSPRSSANNGGPAFHRTAKRG